MTSHRAPFLTRLRRYQKVRFPLVALVVSLVPAILSSGVVASGGVAPLPAFFSLIASVAYLLHIRILDEHRDFHHDTEHYRERPIQSGVITKEELRRVDIVASALLLLLSALSSMVAVGIALGMLLYSFFAEHEFFLGEKLRKRFFSYNAVNLGQMLLMQVLVYAFFAGVVPLTPLVIAHFCFTAVGTLIFEFMRKVKIPGEDGTGKDTYTWHMGFHNALIAYLLMLAVITTLFIAIIIQVSSHTLVWSAIALIAFLASCAWTYMHRTHASRRTEQLLQLSFLVQYAILNLIIYFAIM